MINRQMVLKERPRFQIPTEKCFELKEYEIRRPENGELLIQTVWLGLDPYLFSKVKKVSEQSKPIEIGSLMYGATVGRVVASNVEGFEEEDYVYGLWGWQEYYLSNGDDIHKVDKSVKSPSYMLGALGASGLGAYLANKKVLNIKPGDTVFCSAATGALGQIIGQIAKLKGGIVYGAASTNEKCELAVSEMGYEKCFNHKDKYLNERIREEIPNGIDAMVVSTGGPSFEAAFPLMNKYGRIAICGMMAWYSMNELPRGSDKTMFILNEILLKRLRVQGSVSLDYLHTDLHKEFLQEMTSLIQLGAVKPVEHITEGLENAPRALRELFDGKNVGKSVVKVCE